MRPALNNSYHPRTIEILREARQRLMRDGFLRGLYRMDDKGNRLPDLPGGPWTFVDSIRGDFIGDAGHSIAVQDAQRILRKVLGLTNLWEWAAHPYRERADCILAIDRARLLLGDRSANPQDKTKRRGGWVVGGRAA